MSSAAEPDWSSDARIERPRNNPYDLPVDEYEAARRRGVRHVLSYPVEISGMQVPWRPLRTLLDGEAPTPFHRLAQSVFKNLSKIRSSDDFFALLGLVRAPVFPHEGSFEFPASADEKDRPRPRLGVTIESRNGVDAFTLSCAACHTSDLFGKKVFGLSTRFPRANAFFVHGKRAMSLISPDLLERVGGTTPDETALYAKARKSAKAVGAKHPAALGLDTSLAQVALSLAKRERDPVASFNSLLERFPRKEQLSKLVADSKPAVWWNLKYKTRWLSDGSVMSGNPVYTNFLWNEIGRGTDLVELERWLESNPETIRDLTTAVFSAEAPRITEFFPVERISVDKAKRGEKHFLDSCAKCHGVYVKNWSLPHADSIPLIDAIKTSEVRYPEQTRVKDVGTDPNRWIGMKSLEDGLNPLRISERNGILIQSQKGYVPPPLVGIWARFPYLHNNSVPNLCALLTRSDRRPSSYWSGPAIDPNRDFDFDCVGYPTDASVPEAWRRNKAHFYDTTKPGLSNSGHDVGIFIKNGEEVFSPAQKLEIIEFLKTL